MFGPSKIDYFHQVADASRDLFNLYVTAANFPESFIEAMCDEGRRLRYSPQETASIVSKWNLNQIMASQRGEWNAGLFAIWLDTFDKHALKVDELLRQKMVRQAVWEEAMKPVEDFMREYQSSKAAAI